MKIESQTNDVYTNITGGHIILRGKLGTVKLPGEGEPEWRGDRGGHYTYDWALDVSTDAKPIIVHCLPIATHDRAHHAPFLSLQVHCLLLEPTSQNHTAFTRIGTMRVLLDWKAAVKEDFRWISDYAQGHSPLEQDSDIVRIY